MVELYATIASSYCLFCSFFNAMPTNSYHIHASFCCHYTLSFYIKMYYTKYVM